MTQEEAKKTIEENATLCDFLNAMHNVEQFMKRYYEENKDRITNLAKAINLLQKIEKNGKETQTDNPS